MGATKSRAPTRLSLPPSLSSTYGSASSSSSAARAPAQAATSLGEVPTNGYFLLWCQHKGCENVFDNLEDIFDEATIVQLCLTFRCSKVWDMPDKFGRWLFAQERGDIAPSAILVSTWRCAKPCVDHLHAASTSDVSSLRSDAKRPELRPIVGNGPLKLAVAGMVVLVDRPDSAHKAVQWASRKGSISAGVPIYVASDLNHLVDILFTLSRSFGLFSTLPDPDSYQRKYVISL